jgi:hypothetical protein
MATIPPTPDDTNSGTPTRRRESKRLVNSVLVIAGVGVAFIVGVFIRSDGSLLLQLQETGVSRGLITFLVATITVLIALIVAVWVIASYADPEDLKARFSYLKDILATLVGILGTILGFYFGSADKPSALGDTLAVAEIQFRSGQLITVISGGTPPYRYSVSPFDGESKSARVSKDGWLFESIPRSLAAGSQVVVEATDSKDRKATKAATYAQKDRDATAPAPGGQPSTAQPQSPPSAPASPASK